MEDFGRDFSTLNGLTFGLVSGAENLAQSLLRRLQTPQGALWWAPNYGLDVRQFIADGISDGGYELSALMEGELERDERVDTADVAVTHLTRSSITLEARITTAAGPYLLVVGADQAGLRLTTVEADNAFI